MLMVMMMVINTKQDYESYFQLLWYILMKLDRVYGSPWVYEYYHVQVPFRFSLTCIRDFWLCVLNEISLTVYLNHLSSFDLMSHTELIIRTFCYFNQLKPSVFCLSVCLSTYLPIYLSIYTYMSMSISISISFYMYLATYLLTYLPACLPTYLPIRLPPYLPTYLSIYLSIYTSSALTF